MNFENETNVTNSICMLQMSTARINATVLIACKYVADDF
jgi:hypothetical protein